MAIASRDQSTRVRVLANGKETALPVGTTEWIWMHKSLGMQTPSMYIYACMSQHTSNSVQSSNWYESVGPASTKWPAEGLIEESGWVGGFSLNEMKGGIDTMKSVSVDFAPSSSILIIFGGSRPQVGSSGCDKNSENLNLTDGVIEVEVQSYQTRRQEGARQNYGYNENEFIPEKETKRLDSPGEQFHVR
ncbi:hypothetical protein B0H13DRAFT_1921308 [Mycena leptocephala]|nr:hypothetical protein B0H13DRAFT_1921308 [Mycena leptocephala]